MADGFGNFLQNLLGMLQAQAQPRPDLMQGGERPFTYAGRVVTGPQSLWDILARMPQETPDAEGLGTLATLAGGAPAGKGAIEQFLARKTAEQAAEKVPLNPRTVVPPEMYNRLPMAGRSFQTAEDIARRQAGEVLPELGAALPDIPREPVSSGGLAFFERLVKALGIK
jgi:hypothetical protein